MISASRPATMKNTAEVIRYWIPMTLASSKNMYLRTKPVGAEWIWSRASGAGAASGGATVAMRDERRPRGPSRARTPVTGRAQASFYDNVVPYIIPEPCIGVKDGSCVDVCPVDCIHGDEADSQL